MRLKLLRAQADARHSIDRGVVMLAMVPIAVVGGLFAALILGIIGGLVAVVLALAYAMIGGIGGIAMIVTGTMAFRHTRRELAKLGEPLQLPAARVIIR